MRRKRHGNRRAYRTLGAGLVAVLAITAAACSSSNSHSSTSQNTASPASQKTVAVSISMSPSSFTSLTQYVAIDMGYLSKLGIQGNRVYSSSCTFTFGLLVAGKLDFGACDIPAMILASQAAHTQMQVAVGLEHRYPAALVCRKGIGITASYPQGIKDLVGKNIESSAPASQDTADVLMSLEANGYNFNSVHWTYISGGAGDVVAALDAGRIDCGVVFQPTQTELGNSVETVINIQDGDTAPIVNSAPFTSLNVTASYAKANPTTIAKVQQAMAEADAFIGNPANASAVAKGVRKEFPSVSLSLLTKLVKELAPTYKDGSTITQAQFDASLEVYNKEAAAGVAGITSPLGNLKYSQWVLPISSS